MSSTHDESNYMLWFGTSPENNQFRWSFIGYQPWDKSKKSSQDNALVKRYRALHHEWLEIHAFDTATFSVLTFSMLQNGEVQITRLPVVPPHYVARASSSRNMLRQFDRFWKSKSFTVNSGPYRENMALRSNPYYLLSRLED